MFGITKGNGRKTSSDNKIISFGRKWIENSPIRSSTKNNLYTTLTLLESFAHEITFKQMDYKLLLSFEQFMKNKKLGINTIAKHLRHIRTIINEAVRQGIIAKEDSPFTEYKIKTTESHHTYLLPEELDKLEHINLSRKKNTLRHTLDAFLFCCYTGLRYSDFISMKNKILFKLIKNYGWFSNHKKQELSLNFPLAIYFREKLSAFYIIIQI